MITSIRWKIIIFFVLLQVLILTGIGLYLSSTLKEFTFQELEKNMSQQIELLSELVSLNLEDGNYNILQDEVINNSKVIQGRITLIADDGRVLADSVEDPKKMENHADRPEIVQATQRKLGQATRYSTTLQIDMQYMAKKIPGGFVRIAVPVTEINKTLLTIVGRLLFGFILAFSIFLILAWKVSESITEPIERITKTAQKIAHGSLSERIHIYTKDEIGTLSRMFNLMAYQLEETIKKITSERDRLETILQNMVDGLIALDNKKNILLLNPAAEKIFGVESKNVIGKSLIEINRNQQLIEAMQEGYETKREVSTEIHIFYPKEIILKTHLAPIIRDFEVRGMVIIFTDISELRRLEHLKSEFVGNVSHELKTPLTSICGYVETLLDMKIEDWGIARKFLKVINKEGQRLANLIDDLLDLSRLEAKRRYQLIPIRLENIVASVVEILQPKAVEKGIELSIEIPTVLPKIMGSEEQINQVLINLVDNAIKYTPDNGLVRVIVGAENSWVVLKVVDNGIGIPKEDLERIFERFYRVDKARTRQLGGTGLGLSIVKHIVKVHGGMIKVESKVGLGTTFTVKFQRIKNI